MNDDLPSPVSSKAPRAPTHRLAPALSAPPVAAPAVAVQLVTAPLVTALAVLALAAGRLVHDPLGWALALGLFAIVSLFVVRGLAAHHPHPRFGGANLVTLGRAGLICALAGALPQGGTPTWPLWLVAGLAALLDAVDGWLARRSGMSSRFGARFDLEIDALLILALSLLVWRMDRAGAWILAAGAMRYLFIGAMAAWPWLARPLPVSTRRKLVCVIQVVSLLLCLLPGLLGALTSAIGALGLLALTASFAIDIHWLRLHRREPA